MSLVVLLNAILFANSTVDYPARIGLTAQTLHGIAESRFATNSALESACTTLYNDESNSALSLEFISADDARVLGFFLSTNTKTPSLTCVATRARTRPRSPARQDQAMHRARKCGGHRAGRSAPDQLGAAHPQVRGGDARAC